MRIRKAVSADSDAIWQILEPVIRAGETYTLPQTMSRAAALDYWLGPEKTTYVAINEGKVLGTYYLKQNQMGGGNHVCNCGYITSTAARGQGIAKSMCEHSKITAQQHGFRAMQFNFVVATNGGAIRLWQQLGFAIVGTLPNAFRHPDAGYVNAHIMYQWLDHDQD